MGDARKLLKNVDKEVKPVSSSVQQTLTHYDELAKEANKTLAKLSPDLQVILEKTQEALIQTHKTLAKAEALLDPDSPVLYEVRFTMKEISATAKSIRSLAEYLKRNPNSLLMGRGKPGGK